MSAAPSADCLGGGGLRHIDRGQLQVPGLVVPHLYPLLTIKELLARPAPTWVVPGLIQSGKLVVLWAPSSQGKTFVAVNIAASIAAGLPFLGRPVEPGVVVYVAAEGADDLLPRLRAAFGNDDVLLSEPFCTNFRYGEELVSFLDPDSFEGFITSLKSLEPPPRLVIVDTTARVILPGNEDHALDMGTLVQSCDRIRLETGASSLLLHHPGWNPKHTRGSNALEAAASSVIRLDRAGNQLTLVFTKSRSSALPAPIPFRLEEVTLSKPSEEPRATSCRLVASDVLDCLDGDRDKLRGARLTICKTIRDKFQDNGATLVELTAATNRSGKTLYAHLNWLRENDFITKCGRGEDARYRVTAKYTKGFVS